MPREQGGLEQSGNVIEAPLHGVVSQLHVALGDTVEKGAPVLQMEAMKLIHTLQRARSQAASSRYAAMWGIPSRRALS